MLKVPETYFNIQMQDVHAMNVTNSFQDLLYVQLNLILDYELDKVINYSPLTNRN